VKFTHIERTKQKEPQPKMESLHRLNLNGTMQRDKTSRVAALRY